jgi:hypothetical protein
MKHRPVLPRTLFPPVGGVHYKLARALAESRMAESAGLRPVDVGTLQGQLMQLAMRVSMRAQQDGTASAGGHNSAIADGA